KRTGGTIGGWKAVIAEMGEAPLSDAMSKALDGAAQAAQGKFERAMAEMRAGGAKGAAGNFRELGPEAPAAGAAKWGLAGALESVGKLDEALSAFQKAVDLGPELPEAWRDLGALRAVRGERDAAVACFDKAQGLDPSDPWVHVERL